MYRDQSTVHRLTDTLQTLFEHNKLMMTKHDVDHIDFSPQKNC